MLVDVVQDQLGCQVDLGISWHEYVLEPDGVRIGSHLARPVSVYAEVTVVPSSSYRPPRLAKQLQQSLEHPLSHPHR